MVSKRIDGSSSNKGYGFYILLNETSTSVNNNTSTLEYKLYIQNNNWTFDSGGWNIQVNIDGQNVKNLSNQNVDTSNLGWHDSKLLTSGTTTISHKDDGSKTSSVSAYFNKSSYSSYDPGNCSLDGSITLTKIDRLAELTHYPNKFKDEISIIFHYKNPANFKVNLSLNINAGGQLTTLWYNNDINNSITESPFHWDLLANNEVKNKLYEALKNTPNGEAKAKINLNTYNGSTFLGASSSPYLTLSLVESKPELTIYSEEQNQRVKQLINDEFTLLNNESILKITTDIQTKKKASVYYLKINDKYIYNEPFEWEQVIRQDGGNSFIVEAQVKDSHGFLSNIKSQEYHLIDYIPISINKCQFYRVNPTSNVIKLNADITYFQTTIGSTANTITLKIKDINNNVVKTIPSSDYTIDNETHKIVLTSYTIPFNLDYTLSNKYSLIATDIIGEREEKRSVTKGIGIFELGDNEVQINGNLLIANSNRENIKNIKTLINDAKTPVNNSKKTSANETYSCNYINNLTSYSTNETIIGKWNGKTLYSKTISFITPNNPNETIYYNINNIDEIWIDNCNSFVSNSEENLGVNWYYSSNDWIRTWTNKNIGAIRLRSPSNLGGRTTFVTLRYTKN